MVFIGYLLMQQTGNEKDYDVIIIGAGPAGCACALSLKHTGLRVALFDKQDFPRDKVCGDAIPGRTFKVLGEISPGYGDAFKRFPKKCLIRKTQLNYNGKMLEHSWVRESYTCARIDFDNFMLSLVKETQRADIFTKLPVKDVVLAHDGVSVTDGVNGCYTAKVVVGADGAHSVAARSLTNRKIDRRHHVASVRAYYNNVLYTEADKTEIFFHKKFFPGYFWVFPLPGNMVNAGFGMLSSEVAGKKMNIKDAFYEFIGSIPSLSKRFAPAQQVGALEGYGLPLGSRRVQVSGERFLLAGDAASLIDPASGDGIGNAVLSGKLAADQIVRSFGKNDFSAACMMQYETALFGALGRELSRNARIARYGSKMPFLLDIAFMMGKNIH